MSSHATDLSVYAKSSSCSSKHWSAKLADRSNPHRKSQMRSNEKAVLVMDYGWSCTTVCYWLNCRLILISMDLHRNTFGIAGIRVLRSRCPSWHTNSVKALRAVTARKVECSQKLSRSYENRVCTDSGKVCKVMEFTVEIFQVWKIMENDHRYGKVWKSHGKCDC